MARRLVTLALAGAALAAGLVPGVASAGDQPPLTCTVHWRPFYTGPHDVTLQEPYFVC
jgi:hypothetical protein